MSKFSNEKVTQHLSGVAIVTGAAKFIGDENKPHGMLYAKALCSTCAHGKILEIDLAEAQKILGVVTIITASDIPGENQIGHTIKDEPLLADKEVVYVGQPILLILATSAKIAERAARSIKVKYKQLTPILTIEEAIAEQSFYVNDAYRKIERGNVDEALQKAKHVLEGEIRTGTQEHAYLETQRSWAIPGDDNNITIHSATQSTAETQEIVAHVLGIASKDVVVDVKRLGGAFGGKERSAILWACLAALAAYKTKKPVEIKLNHMEDVSYTGKRHPFKAKYKVAFDDAGKILAYEVLFASNGGAFVDLSIPILERALFHADNAYYIPNAKITGVACKTNLPPNTAFRGFGAPQGIFAIETVIEEIARHLNLDANKVRANNFYAEGQLTPYGQPVHEPCHPELFLCLKEKTQYDKLLAETQEFNRTHELVKRGVGVVPVKFGISFTASFLNQASALVWVYTDGTIILSHGGIEMGQQVNTKIAQVVAREFGIDIKRIRVESSNTTRTGNASPTAASTGSDLNGGAALDAVRQIKARLSQVALKILYAKGVTAIDAEHLQFADSKIFDSRKPEIALDFAGLVQQAYMERVDLGAHGFYKTPGVYFDREKMQGEPFYYYVFGCALAQVEVDVLTGVNKLLKVQIVHDIAESINQEIDRGQITGAFMQGFGYCTMEEDKVDETGKYLAASFSTYKIPSFRDLPEDFAIDMHSSARRHASVFGSKAIGEPPLVYGFAAYFAIRNAIASLCKDRNKAVSLAMPATPEAVLFAIRKVLVSK